MPERLNWLILVGSAAATAACLWLASHGAPWLCVAGIVAFAFVNNTPFCLMHEAAHGVAAPSRHRNHLLGVLAGCMFPTSFCLQRAAHLGHHLRNRTDLEMYDYYLPHESRWLRNTWLYAGNLLGLYYFVVVLSNVIYLLATPFFRSAWFREHVAEKLGFGRYVQDLVRLPAVTVQAEIALAFGYQALVWWLLDLSWQGWLLAHYAFALHWSALQYVDHAWSARHVTDGAWDLRVSAPARWLALNYQLHRAHHRNTAAPWTQLPRLAERSGQPTFWQIYWSLWRRGVQPAPPMGAPESRRLFAATGQEP
jgi:fatty acid desaturase